jgi:hypothetical protein
MAIRRIWMPSPCYHGRDDGSVRLIVLHTAEGARTIEDLGNFFANYGNQVSSHVGADDQLGKIGEYVTRGNASWTQANYNNAAVSLELCGFASWTRDGWMGGHHNMLRNCADWIAEEAARFGIPITRLTAGQAQGNGRGVCQHVDLGAGGGGHVDCGSGFPMDYVLDLARGGTITTTDEDEIMTQFRLDIKPGGDDATIIVPAQYASDAWRLRFACRVTQTLRVDTRGNGTKNLTLGLDQKAQGFASFEGASMFVVHVDEPRDLDEPIVCAWSKAN